jgi:MFS transporter, NNP family, nitrate/nitrite transporter
MSTDSESLLSVQLMIEGQTDRGPLTLPSIVGRDPAADVHIDHPGVSRRHTRLFARDGAIIVEDLGSANGTQVERGDRVIVVQDPLELQPGDIVRIGPFRVVVGPRSVPEPNVPWERPINPPTVVAGFAHFFGGFLAWALVPVFARQIAVEIGLDPGGLGPMVIAAVPVFSGAVARISFGIWTDSQGPLVPGVASLLLAAIALLGLWVAGDQAAIVWTSVALLGVGLAALPISIPMGAQRTAPSRRGIALGVISAGSIGVVVAALGGSQLAAQIGWRETCGVALVPISVCIALFVWGGRGAWVSPSREAATGLFRSSGLWYVALLYGITFGGFAALYSFLPNPLQEGQFNLSREDAALVVAMGALFGSLVRPLGGTLADRYTTIRVVPWVFAATAVLLVFAGNVGVAGVVLLVGTMTVLELGTGSVFKLAAQRFGAALATGAGIVGSVGGFVGFATFVILQVVFRTSGEAGVAFAVLAPFPAAAAAWLFATRRGVSAAGAVALPAQPHLQLLDSYGSPSAAFTIADGLTIGRAPDNRIHLPHDDLISRHHARITPQDGAYVLIDAGSRNGTLAWRDQTWRTVREEQLKHGDVLVFGSQVARFVKPGGRS